MRRGPGGGPQSVKKGIWYLGGGRGGGGVRRKRQKGGAFPFGLMASVAAPLLRRSCKTYIQKNLKR